MAGAERIVSDDGVTLLFRLDGGDSLTLRDSTFQADTIRHYEYDGVVDGLPFHGIIVHQAPEPDYLLVHTGTGRQTAVDARPMLSPTGA